MPAPLLRVAGRERCGGRVCARRERAILYIQTIRVPFVRKGGENRGKNVRKL